MVGVLLCRHGDHGAARGGVGYTGPSPQACRGGDLVASVVDGEAEDAYLQVVAVGEWGGINGPAVEVGAVERAGVDHHETVLAGSDFGVSSRHRDVGQHDIAAGLAAQHGDGVGGQDEPLADVGAAADFQLRDRCDQRIGVAPRWLRCVTGRCRYRQGV